MHTPVKHLLQLNKKHYLEGLPLPILGLSAESCLAFSLGEPLTAFVVGKLSYLLLVLRTVTKMTVLRLGT